MKLHKILFKKAKKDKNGYTTILVKAGGFKIPVKAKPLSLIKYEDANVSELDEIKQFDITRWKMKDIPEVTKIIGEFCGKNHYCIDLLEWDGNENAWLFLVPALADVINDTSDEAYCKLQKKINEYEIDSYKPYESCVEDNDRDKSYHAVYGKHSGISFWQKNAT